MGQRVDRGARHTPAIDDDYLPMAPRRSTASNALMNRCNFGPSVKETSAGQRMSDVPPALYDMERTSRGRHSTESFDSVFTTTSQEAVPLQSRHTRSATSLKSHTSKKKNKKYFRFSLGGGGRNAIGRLESSSSLPSFRKLGLGQRLSSTLQRVSTSFHYTREAPVQTKEVVSKARNASSKSKQTLSVSPAVSGECASQSEDIPSGKVGSLSRSGMGNVV